MRIVKYLLLLLLLFAIGAAVFVATQPGDFHLRLSRNVKVSRNVAYIFVNDYRNWPLWFAPARSSSFATVTSGKGATFHWDGPQGDGESQTVFSTENDSIAQHVLWSGFPGTISWKFTDNGSKGTTISISAIGKMGFADKIRTTLSGGPQQVMETAFENSLEKLAGSLVNETENFKISDAVQTWKKSTYYLKQSINSTIENLPRNRRIMRSNLMRFFADNKLTASGRPFVRFQYYDPKKKLAKFDVCVPVDRSVYITPGSDIQSGKLEAFPAVKITLTGDYSHLRDAYTKAETYMREHHLQRSGSQSVEVYAISKENGKSPSHWVTDIYVPIVQAEAPKPAIRSTVSQTAAPHPAAETEAVPENDEISIP